MFEKAFSFWQRWIAPSNKAPTPALDDGDVATATEEDRRVWDRFPTEIDTNIYVSDLNNAVRMSAQIRNVSLGGAKIIVQDHVAPGQVLSVELPADDEVRTVLACVVRCQRDNGGFALGVVFSRELSEVDLQRFGASRTKSSPNDQRRWVRFDCHAQARYSKVGALDEVKVDARVNNISASGVSLSTAEEIEAGSLLNLDLHDRNGKLVRTLLSCVVHTTQRNSGETLLGCNFIRELTDQELAALV